MRRNNMDFNMKSLGKAENPLDHKHPEHSDNASGSGIPVSRATRSSRTGADLRHQKISQISRRAFIVQGSAVAAAFFGGIVHAEPQSSGPVKVGFALPSEGPLVEASQSLFAGFELFLKEKQAQTPRLEILRKDTGPDKGKTLEALTSLVMNQRVEFLVGPVSLEGAEKAVHAVAGSDVILFVTNPSIRLVAGEMCLPGCFRLGPNNYQAAQPLAAWAVRNLGLKLFMTGDDDVQGNERADFFAHAFEKAGGKFVDRVMSERDPEDIVGLLSKIRKSRPDFVFASFSGNSAVAFFEALRSEDPALDAPVIGPESLTGFPHGLQQIGKLTGRVRTLTTIRNPGKLIDRIKEQLGHEVADAAKAAEGYDVAAVITEAVQKTTQVNHDPKEMIPIIEAMEIDGPRGKVRFDKNHEPILETMVQEWDSSGRTFTQKVIANLGVCRTPDFGCGKIGFPSKKGQGPDSAPESDEESD